MSEMHTGGCHCGNLRYQVDAALQDIAHCHCSICRRTSGGIVVTWVSVPVESLTWLAGSPTSYDSGPTCVRYFCNNCGAQVALFSRSSPLTMDVTIATLDHPETVRANRHIWTESRLPWLHLDEQLPQEPGETL